MKNLTKKILAIVDMHFEEEIPEALALELDEMVSRNVIEFLPAKLPFSQMHLRVTTCDTTRDGI